MNFTRRLAIHFREIQKNPPPLCYAEPKDPDQNMTHWIGWIEGPEDTAYAGGRFHFTIDFPVDFPFKPPQMQFVTPVYHPNISPKGEICLDILHSQWSPILTIRSLLISLCSMLADPNPDHGLNRDALQVYRTDKIKFNETASEWTRKYALEDNEQTKTQL
jgi:ubiquitin-conjugating enzyme E2 D/E